MNFFGFLITVVLAVVIAIAVSHALHIFIVPGTNLFNKYEIVKKLGPKEKEQELVVAQLQADEARMNGMKEMHKIETQFLNRYDSLETAAPVSQEKKEEIEAPVPKTTRKQTRRKKKDAIEESDIMRVEI